MEIPKTFVENLALILAFALLSCLISFILAPILTHFLYKYKIVRKPKYDCTLGMESRKDKINTPVMGGILIIFTVTLITILFNWSRSFTWVPIGVMIFSALLGGIDDLLNIFGKERRFRSLSQTVLLSKVHKYLYMRIWYKITLPWVLIRSTAFWVGSHPGTGVHVHEKLFLQFIAGAVTAWWVFFKLGDRWKLLDIPFNGEVDISWVIIPIIILMVMFTANAVNIADGMDGLASGMLIPTFSALTILSWIHGSTELAILNATVAGSLITYTYFNIKPARFQMGDVGSLGLGALLAVNAIAINQIIPLIFLGFMFYIETFSVLIQVLGRFFLGRRIFRMTPIHHHFELIGWSEEKTIMRFWIVHLAFVVIGLWIGLN